MSQLIINAFLQRRFVIRSVRSNSTCVTNLHGGKTRSRCSSTRYSTFFDVRHMPCTVAGVLIPMQVLFRRTRVLTADPGRVRSPARTCPVWQRPSGSSLGSLRQFLRGSASEALAATVSSIVAVRACGARSTAFRDDLTRREAHQGTRNFPASCG